MRSGILGPVLEVPDYAAALRAEARELARAAREGLAGFGELFQPDVDEIDAWLRAHRHG